jgi:hypothetical protein
MSASAVQAVPRRAAVNDVTCRFAVTAVMLIGMQSDAPDELAHLRRQRWAVRAALALAQPNPIAQAIAAWPPVALLVTVELIARIPIRRRIGWLRLVATLVIAAVAAWVSYWHMAGVVDRYGERGLVPYLLPLSVDGLIVVMSISLVELAGKIRAVVSTPPEPATEPANPTATAPPSPQVSLIKARPIVVTVQPGELPTDSTDRRRLYALGQLLSGAWDVEQSAAHGGLTVRRFQSWADDVAARTRRPRGGPRKPTTEPTERELVGASVAGSDFPADPAAAQEVS